MATYKIPGVYIEETSVIPPAISQVETAMPAFVGYTQKTSFNNTSLLRKPRLISSLLEYESIFGKARPQPIKVNVNSDGSLNGDVSVEPLQFRLYHSMQLYFANGGGPCIIISIGVYPAIVLQSNVYDSHIQYSGNF